MKICSKYKVSIGQPTNERALTLNCFVTRVRYTFYRHYHCLRFLSLSLLPFPFALASPTYPIPSTLLSFGFAPVHTVYLIIIRRHCMLWWYRCAHLLILIDYSMRNISTNEQICPSAFHLIRKRARFVFAYFSGIGSYAKRINRFFNKDTFLAYTVEILVFLFTPLTPSPSLSLVCVHSLHSLIFR